MSKRVLLLLATRNLYFAALGIVMPPCGVCRTWETRELPGEAPLERKIVVPFPVEAPLSGTQSFDTICERSLSHTGAQGSAELP